MVVCNGKSAVDQLNSRKLIKPMEAHYNLLAAIQVLQSQSPIKSKIIHVKGHQDSGVTVVLSRLATMNIEMDKLVKHMVTTTKAQKGKNSILEEPWSCTITGRKLVKNIKKQLRNHINSPAIVGYWKTKQQGKQDEAIDWEAMGRAMAKSKFNQRKWVAKYVTGFFAHRKNMRWWKMRTATTCPSCREEDKDKTHVIRCKHKTAQQQWDKVLTELENWMIMAKTKLMIRTTIITCLRKWRTGEDYMEQEEQGTYMMHTQDKIGWNLALEGVLTTQW